MTTTVIVKAHCAADKEVRIYRASKFTGEPCVIQDGETHEAVVYDDIVITVREVEKGKVGSAG